MRIPSLFRPAAAGFLSFQLWLLLIILCHSWNANAISVLPIPLPDIDLSLLGRVALTGNFDAVSLFSYAQQTEVISLTNGSQSLLTPLLNSVLATLWTADASILDMCPFTPENGTFVFIGGNFTSLGGVEAQGIARYDPVANTVTSLPVLSGTVSALPGTVSALLCDQSTNSVYIGGDFQVGNSSNAIAWMGNSGWSSLPFGGFNGPVSSIMKADNGHIIFGGVFDGLGNVTTPKQKNSQAINLQSAKITSDAQSATPGFADPTNIVCKSNPTDGAGNTWLLADHSPGFWRADMRFGFRPSMLRLYNTYFDGRGTKTFRFRALPGSGIMNLSYTDPETGNNVYCDTSCPLSNNKSETYRDFRFVNVIGMNGFLLEISEWYGDGAGLDGIEIFEDDIYAFAINDFNEPTCGNISFPSTATATGSWTTTTATAGQSNADYLTSQVTGSNSASVTFQADIKQSGNYSVMLYTPGCIQDGTCAYRGIVNVTGTFASSTDQAPPLQTQIFQTNYFDKYDTIYTGHVQPSSSNFRSSVTLTASDGQVGKDIVALRVEFRLMSSTGGLNGLYEYDPTTQTVNANFASSVIDSVGTRLKPGALISSLATDDGVIYAGGNFSDSTFQNIMSFSTGNATSLPSGGLNAPVDSMLVLDDFLYVGGAFTDTATGGTENLKYISAYAFSAKSWTPLGGGLNGPVTSVVSLPMNVSANSPETTVAVSGDFDEILAFGNNSAVSVSGLAVWVPSQQNWLQNLDVYQMSFSGKLMASAAIANNTTILAGSIASNGIASNEVVSLTDSNGLALQPFPARIQNTLPGSSLSKRDSNSQTPTGVSSGIFDRSNGRNLTILGGHFSATAGNGSVIRNLLFSNDNNVTGLGPGVDNNSTFLTLLVQGDLLFAGGSVTGSISGSSLNGFVTYNLASLDFVTPQPPALAGSNVTVNSIVARPGSTEVYFGGIFDAAGSLPCPSVCFYDTSDGQWGRPGVTLSGAVSSLQWASSTKLIAAGNFNVGGNQTVLATYDVNQQAWSSMDGASSNAFPGPVTAFGPAAQDVSQFWVAGKGSNGSSFVTKYDGNQFHAIGDLFSQQTDILSLQVLGLSKNHDSTDLLNADQILLITGRLVIPGFGNASAAVYNGTSLTPFLLSTTADGQPGTVTQLFSEQRNTFSGPKKSLSTGLVVLISFCIALGCVFLIVVFGIIFNKFQRHRQGYVGAPQAYATDRPTSLRRLPPEYLFDSLKHPQVPTI
ncbi:hypothetical protein Egran_04659 [Elaphomyces granulatus]|uniref:Uncharacterized protein n=1 Tax=Elaphomyces granulatus TaxID=519963 RepID=A0A232LTY8_9EURO|nr:hypothetical protein Egran_04659 [Elaphomyces granulatus]